MGEGAESSSRPPTTPGPSATPPPPPQRAQVEGFIRFDDKIESLLLWDSQIQQVCNKVGGACREVGGVAWLGLRSRPHAPTSRPPTT